MGKTVWRALADVIVVFLAIALAQIGGRVYPPTNAAATMLSPVSPLSPEEQAEFEERVVYLTNLARRQVGLPPLKENPRLGIAARGHSQDMADHDYFGHTGSDGSTLADRLNAAGYVGWVTAGENIAAGYTSPESVMDGWLNSTVHMENIYSQLYREIGVGYAYDPDDTFGPYYHYWTQDFGYRPNVFPVIIENEAPLVGSSRVHLYIYGEGWAVSMLISNSPDFAGASWEPFSPEVEWDLTPGEGPKTVYVRLKNEQDLETVVSDTVTVSYSVTPMPTWTPGPTWTPTPTRKPKATWTPTPTITPSPTDTPWPTTTPTLDPSPVPTATPWSTPTPTATRRAKPTATSLPTPTPTQALLPQNMSVQAFLPLVGNRVKSRQGRY
jgi:uncharacterized protein YkwD